MALGEMASQVYESAVELAVKMGEKGLLFNGSPCNDMAFYFSEQNKSMVLLEAMAGQEGMKFAGIPDSLLEKEHSLKINMANFEKQFAASSDKASETKFSNYLFTAKRQYEQLVATFEKKYPAYYNLKYSVKMPAVKDIQNILDTKTVLRTYFKGDSTIYIVSLSKNNLTVNKVPVVKSLNDSIIWYRYGLTKASLRMQNYYRRLGYLLYQKLFPTVLPLTGR